jgi:hypothetical protein
MFYNNDNELFHFFSNVLIKVLFSLSSQCFCDNIQDNDMCIRIFRDNCTRFAFLVFNIYIHEKMLIFNQLFKQIEKQFRLYIDMLCMHIITDMATF